MKRWAARAAAGIAVAAVLFWAIAGLDRPYAGFDGEKRIEIRRGMSTREIAAGLAAEGVVADQWRFLLLRALRPRAPLQAGEYRFAGASTPRQVFDRIAAGDVVYYELRVPEGSNVFEIARAVEALGVISSKEFLDAAADPSAIRDLAPEAETLEGYLFPSTYRLVRSTTAVQLSRLMVAEFRRQWRKLGSSAPAHRTVTLASLVEKETGDASERELVASVFSNRLEQGIKLDCDPTVIYAALLENRYDGVIHRSDLASRNRYNTYRHSGLPPGPIANPGLASLKAALAPAETEYLFFVASPAGDGTHLFSATSAEHERAVRKYRRAISKNVKKEPARSLANGRKPGPR